MRGHDRGLIGLGFEGEKEGSTGGERGTRGMRMPKRRCGGEGGKMGYRGGFLRLGLGTKGEKVGRVIKKEEVEWRTRRSSGRTI
jgi:hypothetical protein